MIPKIARNLAFAVALGASVVAAAQDAAATRPYKVVDGYKVDDFTLTGFRTWRAAACDRCHGANQEGLVGPSLVESLKTLSKDDFVRTLTQGRLEKGMPSWAENKQVMGNIDALYAYLKGRSDGAITKAHVEPMAASTPTS
jgi:mono/diheme cytochrome c family protein